jgi:hypothetical protein
VRSHRKRNLVKRVLDDQLQLSVNQSSVEAGFVFLCARLAGVVRSVLPVDLRVPLPDDLVARTQLSSPLVVAAAHVPPVGTSLVEFSDGTTKTRRKIGNLLPVIQPTDIVAGGRVLWSFDRCG